MKVSEIIKNDFVLIRESESIEVALETMNRLKINGMPVVNKDNMLSGMVVKADIYRFLMHPGHYDTCPVEWVMSKNVVTADGDEELAVVAKRLREHNIIAMPVLKDDKIMGVITIEDFLDNCIAKGV
ncbi:CBS domain-containing protein [Desulfonispora thiosulfatigenes DSM 11270]|uniref:CBS domain-containing protein n=1 Tax=Desulfonispora thiosulfatigenes DSM 11270 TaxID=656914 RepID=A0A1W1VDD9_DESTI|nr:CBS domain-containing protein [Desulfonispora thiosulfatigenes]SMB91326.1 CBS domain-containing protein [Desulfonispora thiosulfatigenes DSM 11270]